MVRRSDEEYPSELFETLLDIDTAREFSGHTESGQSMGNWHCTGMVSPKHVLEIKKKDGCDARDLISAQSVSLA